MIIISQGYSSWVTSGGNNTQDNVFLLSYAEAIKYFDVTNNDSNNTKSRVAMTAYAARQFKYMKYTLSSWWLRSPGDRQDYAMVMNGDYNPPGNTFVNNEQFAVRPALWIDLESDIVWSGL